MAIPSVDLTTLNNLSPNLDIGDIADPALRLQAFQYLYNKLTEAVADLNAFQVGGAIKTVNLADGNVITVKLADNAVTGPKVLDGAIITAKLADGNVTTLKIADGNITRLKLADKVVGAGQLDDAAVGQSHHQDNGIPSRAIGDNVILQRHMSDNSVGSAEIQAGAVTATKIPNGTINSQHIDAALLSSSASLATQVEFDKRGISVEKYSNLVVGGDWTSAIQTAINDVNAAGGGIVYLPRGVYLISSSLIMKNNVVLMGAGRVGTVIKKTGAFNGINAGVDGSYNVGNRVDRFGISSLTLDGNGLGGRGISLTDAHYYVLDNLAIRNNTGARGLSVDYSWTGEIRNVESSGNDINFWIYQQANAISCKGLYSNSATTTGYYLGGCLGLWLSDIAHEQSGVNAIQIVGYTNNLKINGVYIEASQNNLTSYPIYVNATGTTDEIKNVSIENVLMIMNDYNAASRLIFFRYYINGIKISNIHLRVTGTANLTATGLILGGLNASQVEKVKNVLIENVYVDDQTTGTTTTRIVELKGQIENATVRNLGSAKYSASNAISIDRQTVTPYGSFVVEIQGRQQRFPYGITANRPASPVVTQQYFDTTLGKILTFDGTNWKDGAGATV